MSENLPKIHQTVVAQRAFTGRLQQQAYQPTRKLNGHASDKP